MAGPVLEAKGLVKHFPVKRGILSRQVAFVRAVHGSRVVGHGGHTVSPTSVPCPR